jgi:hypothetical protein
LVDALRSFQRQQVDRAATRRHAEGFGWAAVAAGNFAMLSAAAHGAFARSPVEEVVAQAMKGVRATSD